MSGISNYSPAGQSGYLLPTGYLSTQGSQIVDARGNNVRIASVGYFTWNGASSQQIQSDIAGIKAAAANGAVTRQAVRDAVFHPGVKYDTVLGTITFDEVGDTTQRIISLYKVEGGAWKFVEEINYGN